MLRLWVFCVALCAVSPVFSATYEDTFTPKANKAYNEDLNVWVYTSKFAERFAMPKEWIDDGLKGAYAVAFRVEALSGRKMFPHKGEGVSMARRHCILDVYVDADADIPWGDDQIADFKSYQPSSPSYLIPQSTEDQRWRSRAVGVPVAGEKAREPLIYLGLLGNRMGGSLSVREYHKKLYRGITYISLSRSCMTPPKSTSWIEFMKDGSWDYGKHAESDVAYKIEIPEPFMRRLFEDWYQNSRRPAEGEWDQVIRRE